MLLPPLAVPFLTCCCCIFLFCFFLRSLPLSKSSMSVAYAQYAECTPRPQEKQSLARKLIHFATLAAPLSRKSRSNVCRINKNIICCDLAQRKCKHSSANAARKAPGNCHIGKGKHWQRHRRGVRNHVNKSRQQTTDRRLQPADGRLQTGKCNTHLFSLEKRLGKIITRDKC